MSESFLVGELNRFAGEWERIYCIADSEIAAQEWVRANVPGWEAHGKLEIVRYQTVTRRAPLAHGGVGVVDADPDVVMHDQAYEHGAVDETESGRANVCVTE